MTSILDFKNNPLEKGKLYAYSGECCIINDLNLKKDKSSSLKGHYLDVNFASGQRKIYQGAFAYFHPIVNFDKTLSHLEKQVQFLKEHKPNQSEHHSNALLDIQKYSLQNRTYASLAELAREINNTAKINKNKKIELKPRGLVVDKSKASKTFPLRGRNFPKGYPGEP